MYDYIYMLFFLAGTLTTIVQDCLVRLTMGMSATLPLTIRSSSIFDERDCLVRPLVA
jgi:hypothetical protein